MDSLRNSLQESIETLENRWDISGWSTLENMSHLGWHDIPKIFWESHSKFHGSSHHQPDYIVIPIINHY